MSAWKNYGRMLFPELDTLWKKHVNATEVWRALRTRCLIAYETGDLETIERTFKFAKHFIGSSSVRLRRAIQSEFLQHLAVNQSAREDLPNRLNRAEISAAFDSLSWQLDEDEVEGFKREMRSAKEGTISSINGPLYHDEEFTVMSYLKAEYNGILRTAIIIIVVSVLAFILLAFAATRSGLIAGTSIAVLLISGLIAYFPVRDGHRWLIRRTNLRWTFAVGLLLMLSAISGAALLGAKGIHRAPTHLALALVAAHYIASVVTLFAHLTSLRVLRTTWNADLIFFRMKLLPSILYVLIRAIPAAGMTAGIYFLTRYDANPVSHATIFCTFLALVVMAFEHGGRRRPME